ncbi:MAG: RtcB family protein [Armatimonadota bacterium]|nr:MAG: RtcB family protein [Armatimonadota bacterium]
MSNVWNGPLEEAGPCRYRIPRSYKPQMRTDGIVYASAQMIRDIKSDQSPEQIANVACLPGIVGNAVAMPDIHYGYGFPIGGVAATDIEQGVVSPGGVGYDINCGVRLLRTDLRRDDVAPKLRAVIDQIFRDVPSGVGSEGRVRVDEAELRRVLQQGARWAVGAGYGWPEDIEHIEDGGRLEGADPGALTERARKRGRPQLGTLGAGNHFLEVQEVCDIYDENVARAFGIEDVGQVTIMIHTGSRGLGYQVCDDALAIMQRAMQKYALDLPDRQLACAPVTSPEGREYLAAMACAANYAWANRTCITHWVREAFARAIGAGPAKIGLQVVYDVAHNIAKIEEHEAAGKRRKLCVHRKGATRAFPAGHPDVPRDYAGVGQPVIVPGDMGTHSYLLVGIPQAMSETFGSTCHGAGRLMSRKQAIRTARDRDIIKELADQGIHVRAASRNIVAEEMPAAYKDVDVVAEACECAGLSRRVARMRPLGVMKG